MTAAGRCLPRENISRSAPRCGLRVALPPADTPIELTQQQAADLAQRRAASLRSRFKQVLFRLTSLRHAGGESGCRTASSATPGATIATSAGWSTELAKDLIKAGITVLLDRRENVRIGASVPRFVERIAGAAQVVVVGTPLYRTKYDNGEPMGAFVVAAEGDLIGKRMIGSEADKESVLPVLLDGTSESSFPPLLQGRVYADFRAAEQYFPTVFDLIVSLYQISSHQPVRELRRQLDQRF